MRRLPFCESGQDLGGNYQLFGGCDRFVSGLVTADHYGRIRAALAKAGTPIPENDIWIAAIAKEFQLPIAVRDAHFDQVAGLQVLKW